MSWTYNSKNWFYILIWIFYHKIAIIYKIFYVLMIKEQTKNFWDNVLL